MVVLHQPHILAQHFKFNVHNTQVNETFHLPHWCKASKGDASCPAGFAVDHSPLPDFRY